MEETNPNTSAELRGTGVAHHLNKFWTDTGMDTAMVTMETNLCKGLEELQAMLLLALDHMCMLQDKLTLDRLLLI